MRITPTENKKSNGVMPHASSVSSYAAQNSLDAPRHDTTQFSGKPTVTTSQAVATATAGPKPKKSNLPKELRTLYNKVKKFSTERRVPKDPAAKTEIKALKQQAKELRGKIVSAAKGGKVEAEGALATGLLATGQELFQNRERVKAPILEQKVARFQENANGQEGLAISARTKLGAKDPAKLHEAFVLANRLLAADLWFRRIEKAKAKAIR